MVSEEDRKKVIKLWVEGLLSYRQILKEVHLSTGTVSGVIKEEKKRQPDLEELRALNGRLKDGPGYAETLRAANYLREFGKAGLGPRADVLMDAGRLMKAHPDDFEGAIEAGGRITSLEKSENKSFEELLDEADRIKGEIQEGKRTLASLERQTREVKAELGHLEEYERMKKELADLGMDVNGMNSFTAFHKRLDALGFDKTSATALANAMSKCGLTPNEGAAELAEALKKHSTLRFSISDLKDEEKRLREGNRGLGIEEEGLRTRLTAARREVEALTKTVEGLKGTIDILRATVTDLQDTVRQVSETAPSSAKRIVNSANKELSSVATRARKQVDKELGRMTKSVAKSARTIDASVKDVESNVAEARGKVERTTNQIVEGMDRISKRAFKVGREAERLEPISRAYRFISEGRGKPDFVFPMAMDFMKIFRRWEDENGHRTDDLDEAIKETGENWNPSEPE